MARKQLHHHPAADAFPMMDAKRYAELKADIEQHGQMLDVVLCDGQILDGRNRYKACQELGLEPRTTTYAGDPWGHVWTLNGVRRDLNAEQRYLIWKFCAEQSEAWQAQQRRIREEANRKRSEAAKGQHAVSKPYAGEKMVVGQSVPLPSDCHKTKEAAATASKTNPGAVARGDKLAKDRPDLAEKVRLGELKPSEAHRQAKRDAVAQKAAALPNGRYTVLYADPPWNYSDKQGGDISASYGAAEKHYPAMTLGELKALAVCDLAAENSVLFLWATCPLLEDALELARAWGFKYKAQFVWDKVKHNMGHYNSVRHELLLICTRGSCTPQHVELFDSVQTIERTKHSAKPERFREIIETLYPKGKRIELFARTTHQGWKAWGNEVP